jgi:hypothetical protein
MASSSIGTYNCNLESFLKNGLGATEFPNGCWKTEGHTGAGDTMIDDGGAPSCNRIVKVFPNAEKNDEFGDVDWSDQLEALFGYPNCEAGDGCDYFKSDFLFGDSDFEDSA